jgi:hypothetical protein
VSALLVIAFAALQEGRIANMDLGLNFTGRQCVKKENIQQQCARNGFRTNGFKRVIIHMAEDKAGAGFL